ncbi:hypothetical protein GCM10023262_09370 [Bartonella pachyuromydis]|uniref:Porin n=1 Tax=Bartonella pachyuromydis TaxID=931097 RepID=A0ABP8VH37_9HYPH
MTYVALGVSYAQMQGISQVDAQNRTGMNKSAQFELTDKTMTMIGFIIGGGIDLAITDNVILRVEYRYSDFGKKQFVKDTGKFSYKTNDFRVGAAFKF